jgi:tetratricopeptide (TPR) repeat protein
VLLVLLTVGSTFSTLLIWRAQQETSDAYLKVQVKEREATENFEEADENFKTARAAVDQMLSRIGHVKLAEVPHMEPVRRALLEDALQFYQRFLLHRRGNQPTVRLETARAYRRVGSIYALLGQSKEAEAAYQKGIDLLQALAADNRAEPACWQELALVHNDVGTLLENVGRSVEAERAFRQGLEDLEVRLPAEYRSRPENRGLLSGIHLNLGWVLWSCGRHQEAQQAVRRALELVQKLADEFPKNSEYLANLAGTHNNLGAQLLRTGYLKEAEESFRQGLRVLDQLAGPSTKVPKYHKERAVLQTSLAVVLESTGRFEEAKKLFPRSGEMAEKLAADFSAVPLYQHRLAGTYTRMATLHKHTGLLQEAEKALRLAVEPRRKLAADFSNVPQYRIGLANTLTSLATLLQERAELVEARKLLEEAMDHYRVALKANPRHPDYRLAYCYSLANLATTFAQLGSHDAAKKLYSQAISVCEELATEFPTVGEYQSRLAEWLQQDGIRLENRGELAEARRLLERAVVHEQAALAHIPRNLLYRQGLSGHYRCLTRILTAQGQMAEAEKVLDQALVVAQGLVMDFPDVPDCRLELARIEIHRGNLLRQKRQLQKAEESYGRAQVLLEKLAADFPTVQEYHGNFGMTLNNLAVMWRERGDLAKARRFMEQACDRARAALKPNPRHFHYRLDLSNYARFLAELHLELKEPDQAEKLSRELLTLAEDLFKDFPEVPAGLDNLAHGHGTLGFALAKRGQRQEAEKHLRQAVHLYDQLPAGYFVQPYSWLTRSVVLHNLALCVGERGDLTGALELVERAILCQQAALKPDSRDPHYRQQLLDCLNHYLFWTEKLTQRKEYGEAEKASRRLAVLAEQVADGFPGLPDARSYQPRALLQLGEVMINQGQPQEAEQACRAAILILRTKLVEPYPANPEYQSLLGVALRNLALCHVKRGEFAEAQQFLEEGIRHQHAALKAAPQDSKRRQHLVECLELYRSLADSLAKRKESAEAEKAYRRLSIVAEQAADDFPGVPDYWWQQALAFSNLGHLLIGMGQPRKAEEVFRAAVPVLRNKLVEPFATNPDYQSRLGAILHNLALQLQGPDQQIEVCKLFREAISHQRLALDSNPKHATYRQFLGNHYFGLANILARMGNHDELAKVMTEWPRFSPDSWREPQTVVDYLAHCVVLARKDGKLSGEQQKQVVEKYADLIKKPLQDAIERLGNDAVAHNTVARFLTFQDPLLRDPARALPLAKKAVELAPKDGGYWNTLAWACYRVGDWQATVTAVEKAMELRQGGDSFNWFLLAMAHWQLGHKDQAGQWYDRAVLWMEKNHPGDDILRGFFAEATAVLGLRDRRSPGR